MPLFAGPLRRALAAFLSAAVALAAASIEAPAQAQKPHTESPKKKKPKDGAKSKSKTAKGAAAPHGGASHGAASSGAAASHGAKASGASAAKPAEAPIEVKPIALSLPITRATLGNGLRVVMNVDHASPTIAIAVVYDVGARHEEKGKTGLSSLIERMMFDGSKNVKAGEHARLVTERGGTYGSAATVDRTDYFEVLPANELALGLWLEADRMKSLDVAQESLESQRKRVKDGYRTSVSDAAYAASALRLGELVFQGYWPYEHGALGSIADVDAAQLDWVKDFHAKHYGPNNAVLAIAGDFDAAEATALVDRYFGAIPKIEVAAFVDAAIPEQTSQRTAVVKDDHALAPAVLYGWPAPATRETATYALDLAAIVLGGGESSRLHRLLVRDKGAAQSVSAQLGRRAGPSLFTIDARLTADAKAGEVEGLVDGAVRDLAAKGPTAQELAKAQRIAQARLAAGLESNAGRALALAHSEASLGDAAHLAAEPGRYVAITGDDVKKAVADHLALTRRTIVETYPAIVKEPGDAKKPVPAVSSGPSAKKKADAPKKKKVEAAKGKGKKAKKSAP